MIRLSEYLVIQMWLFAWSVSGHTAAPCSAIHLMECMSLWCAAASCHSLIYLSIYLVLSIPCSARNALAHVSTTYPSPAGQYKICLDPYYQKPGTWLAWHPTILYCGGNTARRGDARHVGGQSANIVVHVMSRVMSVRLRVVVMLVWMFS